VLPPFEALDSLLSPPLQEARNTKTEKTMIENFLFIIDKKIYNGY
jgi:hypothetical protein